MHDRHLQNLLLSELREMLDQERERAYRKQEGERIAHRQDDLIRKNFNQAEQLSQLEEQVSRRTDFDRRFRQLGSAGLVGALLGVVVFAGVYFGTVSPDHNRQLAQKARTELLNSLDQAAPLTAQNTTWTDDRLTDLLSTDHNIPVAAGCFCVRPQGRAEVSGYEWCVLTESESTGCTAQIAQQCEAHYDFVSCMDPFSANVNVLLGAMTQAQHGPPASLLPAEVEELAAAE